MGDIEQLIHVSMSMDFKRVETLPDLTCRVRGFALTARMIDMGITGMAQDKGEWVAEFSQYPGLQFLLPKPVADWLFANPSPAPAPAQGQPDR